MAIKIKNFGIDKGNIYVYELDSKANLVACNRNFLLLFGDVEAISNSPFSKIWDFFIPHCKDVAANIRKNNLKSLSLGSVTTVKEDYFNSDGERISCTAQKLPIVASDNVIGLLSFASPVVQMLDSDDEINSMALEHIVANMPGHVYWKNKQGVYLGCNDKQAQSLGLSCGENVIGKTDFELPWAAISAMTFRNNDIKVMASAQPLLAEEPAKIDGQEGIVLSHKMPLKSKQGEIIGILGLSIDITKQKAAEDALKKAIKEKAEIANKAKSAFISNMSHDLRTPISGIIGLADIYSSLVDDNELKSVFDDIKFSGEQLLKIVNEVLEISALDVTKNKIYQKSEFSIRDLIEKTKQTFMPAVKHKKLGFSIQTDGEVPEYLYGPELIVQRILLNLVSNAIKFTQKGEVSVLVKFSENKTAAKLRIKVTDTGIGIPSEMQKKIFDRFERLTPSYQNIYPGSGLGLFLVKQFVEHMQGTISLTSKVGKGSNFICELPIASCKKGKNFP